jgi:hypothetical protein
MAIKVGHEPVLAAGKLAVMAGQARHEEQRQLQNDRMELAQLQGKLKMDQMRFGQAAQQEARAEEFQYQQMLNGQKRSIDMDIELQAYARQKQSLTQAMNMINDSNEFSDREKEELRIQAMSKYANVGTGISPSSMDQGGMADFVQKGAYKSQLLGQWQQAIDDDQMSVQDAQRLATGLGMSGAKFQTPQERMDMPFKEVRDRLDTINRDLNTLGVEETKKGKLYDRSSEDTIPEDSTRAKNFRALQRSAEKATAELMKLQMKEETDGPGAMTEREFFEKKVKDNPAMLDAVQRYGAKRVYKDYMKKYGVANGTAKSR